MCIIGAVRLTSEMFSHTLPSKTVSAIFQMWLGFFPKPSQSLMFSMRTFLSTKGAVTLKRKRNQKKPDTVFRRRYPGTFLPIFSQFRRKTRVNELKMFTLLCNFLLSRKRRNIHSEIFMIRC